MNDAPRACARMAAAKYSPPCNYIQPWRGRVEPLEGARGEVERTSRKNARITRVASG